MPKLPSIICCNTRPPALKRNNKPKERDDDENCNRRILHNRSRPGTKWCKPIDWTPDTDWSDDDWSYEDGSLWSDNEEEAGLAIVTAVSEGEVIEVGLSEVFWSTCGECQYLQDANLPKE